MMKKAISELEIWLGIYRNNEPIHRAEGNIEQADFDLEMISSLKNAISVLESVK